MLHTSEGGQTASGESAELQGGKQLANQFGASYNQSRSGENQTKPV